MTADLRWGVLSTARINDALLFAGAAEFVAVASRTPERAAAYAREKGIPKAYGSYDALLAAGDVDAVYISLPNGLHIPWSIRALEAGKHVLCEKPLSRRAADVAEAYDVAGARGLVFAEALMWRHHPQVAQAQQLIADGAVGELKLIRARFSGPVAAAGDPRLDRAMDGGSLMDVGCYCVSGARTLAGAEPLTVHAERICGGDGDVDLVLTGLLRFPDDVLASIECGFGLAAQSGLEAVGDEGVLRLLDPWHAWNPGIEVARGGRDVERIEPSQANHYALQLRDFAAAVAGDRAPLLGRADALGQARAIEALYAAAEGGDGGVAVARDQAC
jgi:predicted dehydrogenase